MSSPLAQRWQATPFVIKFALGAGAFAALYFAVVERGVDSINRDGGKSESAESALEEYARSGGKFKTASEAVSRGVRQFGEVSLPGDPQSRPSEFNSAVDSVLNKHGVDNVASTSRTTPMGNGPLTKYLGTGQRVDRVMKELTFSTTPEKFDAVLADLERTPEVAAISRVQVRQGDEREKADRLLKISISLETWTVARKEPK
ncbi:MAG: hypothetical protein U0637_09030 [Phycisphaerales bacterium]